MLDRQTFLDAERDKWLTPEEVAHVLRVSLTTVSKMLRNQTLAHRREGRVIRIHLDSLKPQPQEASHAPTVPTPHAIRPVEQDQFAAARRRFSAAHSRRS